MHETSSANEMTAECFLFSYSVTWLIYKSIHLLNRLKIFVIPFISSSVCSTCKCLLVLSVNDLITYPFIHALFLVLGILFYSDFSCIYTHCTYLKGQYQLALGLCCYCCFGIPGLQHSRSARSARDGFSSWRLERRAGVEKLTQVTFVSGRHHGYLAWFSWC